MKALRWFNKTHKWLAAAAGLFTFFWFGSAIVMTMPASWWPGGSATDPAEKISRSAPDFRSVRTSIAQAIAATEAAAGHPVEVTDVRFRRIPGHLLYQISAADAGTYLIDASTGERLVVTENLARQMATEVLGSPVREIALVRAYDWTYRNGPLPVYRFLGGESNGSILHIVAATGEIFYSNRAGRVREFLAGLHFLEFLRPLLPGRLIRGAMLLLSMLGLLMSVFGGCILWLQFQGWRAARRET